MGIELEYPILPFSVNQPFGVNGEYYRAHGINIAGHNGIDLRARHGQPIYAAHSGIAYYTDNDGMEGDGVVILSKDAADFNGLAVHFKTIYWHMCDPHKEPNYASPIYIYSQSNGSNGKSVEKGELIGCADNTGFSTGDHLHFGLKPVAAGESPGDWWNIQQNNGYGGAIDPLPFLRAPQANAWEQVAVLAAKYQAGGKSSVASQLWALSTFIKSFMQ